MCYANEYATQIALSIMYIMITLPQYVCKHKALSSDAECWISKHNNIFRLFWWEMNTISSTNNRFCSLFTEKSCLFSLFYLNPVDLTLKKIQTRTKLKHGPTQSCNWIPSQLLFSSSLTLISLEVRRRIVVEYTLCTHQRRVSGFQSLLGEYPLCGCASLSLLSAGWDWHWCKARIT